MCDTSDSSEINRLSRLGVRDDPKLEVTPEAARVMEQAIRVRHAQVRDLGRGLEL